MTVETGNAAESLESQYPSVELAYPIAVASYDVAARRLDAIDGRLQTIMAFVVTLSAALPSIAAGRGVSFHSYWFYIAVALFVFTLIIGTYARLADKLRVLDPGLLYDSWLYKPEWEFKKDFIAYADTAFQDNLKLTDWKWKCTVAITATFFVQTAFLVAWAVAGQS